MVAEALRKAGARVEVHVDHFAQEAPDLKWIPEVGRHGWVLITKDENIRRNPLERAAYQEAKLRGFIVTGGDMSGPELAELLISRLSGMARRVANKHGPLLFTISRGGTFTKLL